MVIIRKVCVDGLGPEELGLTWAVLELELACDCRVFIHQTAGETVRESLRGLFQKALGPRPGYASALGEALLEEPMATVSVLARGAEGDLPGLMALKYRFVEERSAYAPLGYNVLEPAPRHEGPWAGPLARRLRLGPSPGPSRPVGRPPRPVRQYDGPTGMTEWPSVSAAAEALGLSARRIRECCNRRQGCRYHGGSAWSWAEGPAGEEAGL